MNDQKLVVFAPMHTILLVRAIAPPGQPMIYHYQMIADSEVIQLDSMLPGFE